MEQVGGDTVKQVCETSVCTSHLCLLGLPLSSGCYGAPHKYAILYHCQEIHDNRLTNSCQKLPVDCGVSVSKLTASFPGPPVFTLIEVKSTAGNKAVVKHGLITVSCDHTHFAYEVLPRLVLSHSANSVVSEFFSWSTWTSPPMLQRLFYACSALSAVKVLLGWLGVINCVDPIGLNFRSWLPLSWAPIIFEASTKMTSDGHQELSD